MIGPGGFMAGPKAQPEVRWYWDGRGGKRAIACNRCGCLFRGFRSFEAHWTEQHVPQEEKP
jgi:hypothetical protein